ncbi:probable cyclin-dependent serine/threonine-protein kinase DDB_G0292550 [Panonychus citri]|uniref:probable cyclin-dependent serine/threonine-protein kinase DDB_G0292550 n=1 Tax=Panonychus citri TaxID=50023 RepID=UPI00230780EC|nr:probable cyclin-dependent serine/threonine-protein kinase DDB_G0292550 [Panonychus citri]
MTNSIFLIGLSIILLPSIRTDLISVGNQTNYNSSEQLNGSNLLPIFINEQINNTSNGTIKFSLPSIEPIILDSHSVHSIIDGQFKPMVNLSSSSNFTNGFLTLSRLLANHDQNVSSSVIDHRLWSSKRVKPLREPVTESTSDPSGDSGDGRTNNNNNNSFEELKFDQNYFALLNAVNHRPVSSAVSDSMKKDNNNSVPSGDSHNSTRSLFYYSPETYGKVSHKNHQNTAFSFNWPPAILQSAGLSTLSTPTPLTQIKSVPSSSSSQSNPSSSSSSSLILPDHPGKPSKHDIGTFNFLNNSPIIKSYSNEKQQSTSNGTIKNDYQENSYLAVDPNKLIVDRGQQLNENQNKKVNYSKDTNSNNNNNDDDDDGNEANGGEGASEPNESNSDGNSDSNQPGNLIKNVDINSIQNNNGGGNINKYYDNGAYMVSKGRSKVSQGSIGDNNKPLRFQDHVIQQSPGPQQLTPSIDYLEEDYESTDAFPDFKNLQPIVKTSTASGPMPTATAKYNGPAPYRHPYYSSYYPTRFYGPPPSPYDDDNSPSKSGNNNNVNSWSGLAGFLLGIIPLGILMASMVPAFVSVPVATAAAGVGRRRRRRSLYIPVNSLRDDPVHDILGQYEMKMLRDVDCIKEILCKVAVQGKSQKMGKHFFEATINMRFNKIYNQLGIGQVMETAKRNECEKVFQCKKLNVNQP